MSDSHTAVMSARWPSNRLTERLGLRFPIVQAPMASATTPQLAAAVSNAGALGSLGLAFHSASAVRADCRTLRAATNGSYNINFFVHREPKQDPVRDESMRAALAPFYQELGLGEVPLAQASAPPFNAEHLEAVLEMAPAVVA